VSVADRIAKTRLLAAKFTYHCHWCFAPDRKVSNPLKIHATRDSSKQEAICLIKRTQNPCCSDRDLLSPGKWAGKLDSEGIRFCLIN
jgi:hypothetical protein